MLKRIHIIILLTLTLSACSNNPKEQVLFSSNRNGNSDIFIMDIDGGNQQPLTQTSFEEWGPSWINEDEISFLRQKGDSIFRIKLELSSNQETQLEHPSNCILDDKNMLYNTSNKYQLYSCENDIFIMNPTYKEVKNITKYINGKARYPSWSHDGKDVIFTSNHKGTNQVFLYDTTSENMIQLTDSNSNNERGELSPNKKILAYSSDFFEKGNQEILIKNLETNQIENISKSSGMELIARFSNDGKKLFYGTNKDGNWELYAYDLNTKKHIRLTNNNDFDGDPRFLKYKGKD
jgi:TolB protein